MKKSLVLARFDDYCTKEYIDRILATTTHKMSLNLEYEIQDRPIYRNLRKVHEAMYVAATAMASKVKFVVCDYLPHNDHHQEVMVISKCFIKKNTVLYDVGGHHFPISKELIIDGVNDFSLLYSGKSNKKDLPHLLLGPISYVNHSCYPNSIFDAHSDGKIYIKTIKDIGCGDEITVEYSDTYFGNSNCKCLCMVCCTVSDVVEELIKASIACSGCVNDAGVGHDDEGAAQLNTDQNVKKLHELSINNDSHDDEGAAQLNTEQSSSSDDEEDYDPKAAACNRYRKNLLFKKQAKQNINKLQELSISSSSDEDDLIPLVRRKALPLASSAADDDDDSDEKNLYVAGPSRVVVPAEPVAVDLKKKPIIKMLKCKRCSMQFKYRSHLIRHLAKYVQPLWKCNICKLKFNREDTLDRHMLIHDENRPEYSCKICKKTFKHSSSVTYHMSHKHSKKPPSFKCEVCKKTFATSKTLRYHLNVHASLKPFQCPICTETFHQPHMKSRHIKKMHPV